MLIDKLITSRARLLVLLFFVVQVVAGQAQISAERLKKHVEILASDTLEGRGFGSEKGRQAAIYVANEFKKAGVKPYQGKYLHPFHYNVNIVTVYGQNVIGIIKGSDKYLQDEYIVLGAHYDHLGKKTTDGHTQIYNGADDNASGVSTIIELGRQLAKNRDNLKRSVILVAFDGEESGLIGSKALVKQELIPLNQVKIMFSVDMVGMLDTYKGLDMRGVERIDHWQEIFVKPALINDICLQKQGDKIISRTDTKSFGDVGIPSIHVTTGTKSPYHTPQDDALLLEYTGMAKVTNYLYQVTKNLATIDEINANMDDLLCKSDSILQKQWFESGLRINMGRNQHVYVNEFFKGKPVVAAEVGVFAKVTLLKRLALQPELLYSTIGSHHNGGVYRTHALSIPASILFIFATTNGFDGTLYLKGGGYYTYVFRGKLGKERADYKQIFNRQEYGFDVGFIMEVENVQLGYTYKCSLSNLYQNNKLGNIINQGSFATFGLNF